MKYIVLYSVIARRGPGRSWPMGWIREGFTFEDVASESGWVAIKKNLWVPASALSAIEDVPPTTGSTRKYVVIYDVIARRGPGQSWPMGWIREGFTFQDVASEPGWVAIKKNLWVPAIALSAVEDAPPTPVRLRFHSQKLPEETRNYKSFGIVPLYATPAEHKPHSVILDDKWMEFYRQLQSQDFYDANIHNYPCDNPDIKNEAGQKVDPETSMRWLFYHNNTKFYGANFGGQFRIPAQGIMGGNLITAGRRNAAFTEVIGLSGEPPRIEDVYNRPDLIHFCWCVRDDGATINPPCKSAFIPVLNPVGMKGVTNARNRQTMIWISNDWLW